MKVYINNVIVNSIQNFDNLEKVFDRMMLHYVKMNPTECVSSINVRNFLGFLFHNNGIKFDYNKGKALLKATLAKNKEFQGFISQINFLERFIANSSGKI